MSVINKNAVVQLVKVARYLNLSKSISVRRNSTYKNVDAPLAGIRIVDLTRIVAGPYCSMVLGDLGADVIKIEQPGTGDEARKWGPPFIGNTNETCYFIALNRNKRSMCVNLKTKAGREIIQDLVKKSDVLIENFVPGKLNALQLGYEKLKSIAPHLIYCSISGYGEKGPYANRPGYDVIAASVGGLLHITGTEDGAPCKPGVALTDMATGLYAHGAIMAALIKRGRTGKGQKVECNLLSTQISTLINIASNYLNANKNAQKWGTAHASIVPYQAFPTRDGYFTVGAGSDKQFVDFCKRIGHSSLANDAKFLTNADRTKNREELISLLHTIFITKTNAEWSEIFENSQCPYGPVNSPQETFNNPHVRAIGLVQNVKHAVAGNIKLVGPPVVYSEGGNEIRLPPPTLGQHTDEILKDVLKYKEDVIQQLYKNQDVQ